jgi:hypothetical protein
MPIPGLYMCRNRIANMLSLPWEGGSWVLCWIVLNPKTPSPPPSKVRVERGSQQNDTASTAAAELSSALAGTEMASAVGRVICGVGVGWDVHAPGNKKTQNEAVREHLRL